MKALRLIFIALSILLFLFGIVSLFKVPLSVPQDQSEAFKFGYYFGRLIFFMFGFLFLFIATIINKKINQRKTVDLIDSLPGGSKGISI